MAVHYRNCFLLSLHKEYCIHDKSKQCLQYAVRKELGEVREGEAKRLSFAFAISVSGKLSLDENETRVSEGCNYLPFGSACVSS